MVDAGDFDGRDQFFAFEVVEQECSGAGLQRFARLFEVGHFYFDACGRPDIGQCGRDSVGEGAACLSHRGDVVVLDQHAGRQRVAVIQSTAAANRVALSRTQPGRGLACIENLGP